LPLQILAHIICILNYRQVVSDLLQSPQWPTLLRQHWENTTPFRELIKKMPGTVGILHEY